MNNNMIICNEDINLNVRKFFLEKCNYIAIDTETTGLNPLIDKLCLIQIYDGNTTYILKYNNKTEYSNFIEVLRSKKVRKVFHHANFDLRFLIKNLKIDDINNVACTKVAAKLLHGIEEKNGLKYLVNKYLKIDMDKGMQMSDWGNKQLSNKQLEYAQNDVFYLYSLWEVIRNELKINNIDNISEKCFEYLSTNSKLHNQGIENIFIY